MRRVIDPALARRLHAQARADRWFITVDQFTPVLAAAAERHFPGKPPEIAELEHHLETLHLEDLALSCACSAGKEAAWEHFVREYRPILYRAADALQPGGGAREIADALYGELYGVAERLGERRSLLRYFHGRSSLATWLRSVLSQRFVDRVRVQRREDTLPEEDSPATLPAPEQTLDPRRGRNMRMMRKELAIAIAALDTRDRLRLKCYYAQDMTLAAIGKVLKEHEATVSRHLTRTRRAIREALEDVMQRDYGMDEAAMLECFASIVNDPGALDIADLVGTGPGSKNDGQDRSS
jgi:RNA polymerase sigma-70 factor (ECF subfamily)